MKKDYFFNSVFIFYLSSYVQTVKIELDYEKEGKTMINIVAMCVLIEYETTSFHKTI